MEKDYVLLAVGAGLTIIGTLVSFLLDQINRRQDRKERKEDRFYESRRETYAQALGLLRSLYEEPRLLDSDEHREWLKDRKNCDIVLSQAILFAQNELRKKLVRAGHSTYGQWEQEYGKSKAEALSDIEISMKKELGISIKDKEKLWKKLKNLTKKIFLKEEKEISTR